ncbi:MAG: hypothetical protein DIU66_008195 [Bacillota bacterium]|nr:MAG: hypothetical protein DIU66_09135 [Bacillota bacterium]
MTRLVNGALYAYDPEENRILTEEGRIEDIRKGEAHYRLRKCKAGPSGSAFYLRLSRTNYIQ